MVADYRPAGDDLLGVLVSAESVVAARAAYRLGICDTMLAAVAEGDIKLAGIFVEQLRGEREHRVRELAGAGVEIGSLDDMILKGGS